MPRASGRGPTVAAVAAPPERRMAAVAVAWGSIGVLVRWSALPAVALVWSRVAIGSIGLGLYLLVRPGIHPASLWRHRPWCTAATGVLLAGHWVALFAALQRAPIGTVLLITYLGPIMVAAAAPAVLGEHVGLKLVGLLGVAALGCALVVGPAAHGVATSGLVLAGGAALSYALLTLVGKPLAQHYGGVRLAFQQQAVAAVVLGPVAATARWGSPHVAWLWLVLLGLGHTAIGTAVFFSSLARVEATVIGLLGYLEPASAVLCGWWFLAERPGLLTVIGGTMIVAAGLVALHSRSTPTIAPPEVAGAAR